MQRTWATGATENDLGPVEWVAAIKVDSNVTEHLRTALDASILPDATIAQCQAGMLAVECVAYLCGGDADLDPLVHVWIREVHPRSDEELRAFALDVLAKLREDSALATHWRAQERRDEWFAGLDALRDRLANAKRKPDPLTDPRVIEIGKSFKLAEEALRVALVPYEIVDEPIAHLLVAPNLSVVLHYAVEGHDPVQVPIAHLKNWNRKVKDVAKIAAQRTRKVSDIRTHILENTGFEIAISFGNSSFTAGLLPYANLLFEGAAQHGILCGAPNAGAVAYHKILDGKWNEAAVELVQQIRELYQNSAHRITQQLWWLQKGKLVELPYAMFGEQIAIQPVPEFVAAVGKLT